MPAAQYVRAAELRSTIVDRIKSINAAVWDLRQSGIVALLPEKVEFTVIVVDDFSAVARVESTAAADSSVMPQVIETTESTRSGQQINESGSTNQRETGTEASTATSNDLIGNDGNDQSETNYTYQT